MKTYCYVCPECGAKCESDIYYPKEDDTGSTVIACDECKCDLVRDYAAEGKSIYTPKEHKAC